MQASSTSERHAAAERPPFDPDHLAEALGRVDPGQSDAQDTRSRAKSLDAAANRRTSVALQNFGSSRGMNWIDARALTAEQRNAEAQAENARIKKWGIEAGRLSGFKARRKVDGKVNFLKCGQDTEPHHLFDVMALSRQMGWHLYVPSLILSITGSAMDALDLRTQYYDKLTRAIVMASMKTRAWITDGGTEKGVMKMLGQMRAHQQVPTPIIGFATWGCLTRRETLKNKGCYENDKPLGVNDRGAYLDPNHSHFVLVDSGKTLEDNGYVAWGGEIDFRERFEQYVCSYKPVNHMLQTALSSMSEVDRREKAISVPDEATLKVQLEAFSINLKNWEPHTCSKLYHELKERKSTLLRVPIEGFGPSEEFIVRQVSTAVLTIHRHGDMAQQQMLVQSKISEDGVVDQRAPKVLVSTKLRPGETPEAAALRLCMSKFRSLIHSADDLTIKRKPSHMLIKDTTSFPSLKTELTLHNMTVTTSALPAVSFVSENATIDEDETKEVKENDREKRKKDEKTYWEWVAKDTKTVHDEMHEVKDFIHRIQIVVGGGPGTITTLFRNVKNNCPIVLVRGSGRAVDLLEKWPKLANYAAGVPSAGSSWTAAEIEEWLMTPHRNQLILKTLQLNGEKVPVKKLDDLSMRIQFIMEHGQLSWLDLKRGSTEDLLLILFQCIQNNHEIAHDAKLLNAIQWNSVQQVSNLLSELPVRMVESEDKLNNDFLLYAASHDLGDVCRHLIQYGYDVSRLDALILFDLLPVIGLNDSYEMQGLTWQGIDNADPGWESWQGDVQAMNSYVRSVLFLEDSLYGLRGVPHHVLTTVAHIFGAPIDELRSPKSRTSGGGFRPMHKIFWAICTNRVKVARVLWERAEFPIDAGLLASYLCKQIARQRSISQQHRNKYRHEAEWYDRAVTGVCDHLPDKAIPALMMAENLAWVPADSDRLGRFRSARVVALNAFGPRLGISPRRAEQTSSRAHARARLL